MHPQAVSQDKDAIDLSDFTINKHQVSNLSRTLKKFCSEWVENSSVQQATKEKFTYKFESDLKRKNRSRGKFSGIFTMTKKVEIDYDSITPIKLGDVKANS